MSNLPEQNAWESGIHQLEEADRAKAGPGGVLNIQANQLANRTRWLRALVESAQDYREYTFYKSESDPDGTIAGLANTPSGKMFRVAQGLNDDLAFIYYLNDSGTGVPLTALLGRGAITNNVREYSTLTSAENDVVAGNILDGSKCWVSDPTNETLTVEYINNGGTLEVTGRKIPSQEYIDSLIKPVGINSPVASIATKDGFSVCSFYVNEDTGDIELIVDKIPQVNADAVNLSGVTLARSDSGILSFQDSNGLDLDLVDLIAQIAGESVVTTGDTAALLSADAAAYIAQNYNLKRHPVAVIRRGLNIWFVYGQSFTLGTAAKGILTRTESPLGNLMLGQSPRGSNLNPSNQNYFAPVGSENKYYPLRERRQKDDGTMTADDSTDSTTFGETILSGLLETLKDNHNRRKGVINDTGVTFAGSCCGTVGVSITALQKRTAANPANNAVGNPTFANSASGWTAGTVTAVDGVNVLYSGSSYVESAKFDVTAGAVIEVTGRVYFPTAITGTVRVNIRFDGPSLSNVAVAALTVTNPVAGSVYPVSRRITVPTGATTGIYQVAKPSSVSTGISSPSAIPVTGDQLTDYYGRWLSALKGHMEAAKLSGFTQVQVAGIIWMQGENDTGGMTEEVYLGHLADIKASMIADCLAATGQTEPPGFFVYQTGGMYAGSTQKLNVQMAQIGITGTDRGAFFLHNEFPYPRPANHWYANSYRWAGCQYAKEIYPVVSGLNLNPFKPLDAVYDGKAIYVSFSPLYAPLVKQPFYTGTVVTDLADYGFTVIDANGTHYGSAISVEIASDTVMKITPTFTPSGAMTVVLGDANHAGGHNIADSDDQVALYKWTYETGYGLDVGENITALVDNAYPLFNRSASYSISVRTL
ncbi:hypothetical protein NL293_04620 [Klebsiella pneumoniae]|nr:hypothetical protein [Klebsiella pneumoniae]MCP5582395.1 hypothetical protein [Klebsiella pneumoniae]MCP5717888.1 hypothetical protein [Klebsiella pneumoniae]